VSRSLLHVVVAGLVGAVMFVSAVFLPLVGVFTGHVSLVPLIVVGLLKGPGASLAAGLAGVAALSLTGNLGIALAYGLADVLPSITVVALALRRVPVGPPGAPTGVAWTGPGRILGWLTGLGLGILVLAALVLGAGGGFEASVNAMVGQMLDALLTGAPAEARDNAMQAWGPVLPGMVAAGWLMRAVLSAMLALWLVERRGRSARPTPAYAALDLPDGLVVVLAGLLAVGWLVSGDIGYTARNGALLTAVPFVLRGLAAVHLAARQTRYAKGLLAAFYVVFVLASGLAILAVAGLGLVDHFARRRSPKPSRDRQEEE